MSSSVAVCFEKVSKHYSLGGGIGAFKGFLDKVKNGQLGRNSNRSVVAPDEASFSIREGENRHEA